MSSRSFQDTYHIVPSDSVPPLVSLPLPRVVSNQKDLSKAWNLSKAWKPIYCYILCQLTEHCVPTNYGLPKVSKAWKIQDKKSTFAMKNPRQKVWRPTTTSISLKFNRFTTHHCSITISIHYSIDAWEEFSTTDVLATHYTSKCCASSSSIWCTLSM